MLLSIHHLVKHVVNIKQEAWLLLFFYVLFCFSSFPINRNMILLVESVLSFFSTIHSFVFRIVLTNLDLSLLQGVLLVTLSLMGSCQEMFFLSGSE